METKRVAVIGAGISGLVALKECLAEGFDVVCFETRPEIGGGWAYQPDASESVHSSIYAGTMLNSCRDTTSYSDFPLDPARYGDFFNHRMFVRYLREYADHFGLPKHIRLGVRVLECLPPEQEGGAWEVRVQEGHREPEEMVFDAVIAATGHLSSPYVPDFKGRDSFRGQFLHSHYYRTPGPFEGKKVAIIGLGSSAVDIASEIAPQAEELHVITRRGGWILPRYVLGKPTEAWDNRATQLWLPSSLSQWLQTKLLSIVEGDPPAELRPQHKILEQNPTMRGDFLEKVRTGLITIQRNEVACLTETGLVLADGSKALDVDVIISATGYDQFDLPYLPADAVRSEASPPGAVDLYRLIHPPRYPNLFLHGYTELFGPLPSAAEAQARYTAAFIAGRLGPLPAPEKMLAEQRAFAAWQAKNFVHSGRHALTAHHIEYVDSLLAHLGATPTFPRLLGRVFTHNPWTALGVLNAVWFGIPSSAQWRLCGHGAKDALATATVLRIAAGKPALSTREVELLRKEAPDREEQVGV